MLDLVEALLVVLSVWSEFNFHRPTVWTSVPLSLQTEREGEA